ncbi:Acetyltransferase (GNAT) domain-containing protein [Pseudomonas cedrina]|uniref:GNAT family N-acetyltransferase n=2 Tax=Pseudomonas cedrina TaxID=651740 RepID=A0A1V2KE38_PSECE|nr:GNAT family N-acetyltransferase [Pseudomonas cedrina]ONH55774.1 GNAT family N-acetyltransferase [Pseudomonas cedrina subsp. cedrina]SDS92410.1 Acetyltransferase (GNAT) domain-containing protein [Pseudomonas cedrina]
MDATTCADFSIHKLSDLPEQIRELEAQAVAEGFRFVTRLIKEWEERSNQFDQPGECLLGVYCRGQLIAIGGVSRDPNMGPAVGRLRRIYVAPPIRGRKVGKALVQALLEYAAPSFQVVRLSTDTPGAAAFYRCCGFIQVSEGNATHAKSLTPSNKK